MDCRCGVTVKYRLVFRIGKFACRILDGLPIGIICPALNVVNVKTSEVVFSAQGAGEYSLSNREIVGFGGTASYDSTLNGKVLDLAIREAVDALVVGLESGAWTLAH